MFIDAVMQVLQLQFMQETLQQLERITHRDFVVTTSYS